MTTPVLEMTEWVENQNQPHVPVNAMVRTLEVFASLTIVISVKAEPDSSVDEEEGDIFIADAAPTGAWAGHPNEIVYYSNGLRFIIPRFGTIAYVTVTGEMLQYVDVGGGEWQPAAWATQPDSSGGVAGTPYDMGSLFNGEPTASLVLMRYVFPRAVAFTAGLPNSQGKAEVAATAQTDFDIQKNNSSIGTMRFAAAGTVASFIMASNQSFAAGDVLEVIAPASPDATLADIGFTLTGER